jgi:hypothetical protein
LLRRPAAPSRIASQESDDDLLSAYEDSDESGDFGLAAHACRASESGHYEEIDWHGEDDYSRRRGPLKSLPSPAAQTVNAGRTRVFWRFATELEARGQKNRAFRSLATSEGPSGIHGTN